VSPRAFALGLAAIVAAAVGVRLLYAFALVGDAPLLGDALEFHLQANALADGRGYVQPFLLRDAGIVRASADKPPLYPFLEAGVSLLGGRSWAWHHLVGVTAGGGTVAVVGLIGRRLRGPRVGLLAAGLAALSPAMIGTDGSLRTEALYALLIAVVLLLALRLRAAPSGRRAAGLGAVIGLAALTRGEALLLLVLLVLPLAGPRRAGVAALACGIVLTPWLVRNLVVFDRPVLIATNVGGLVAGANCATTYAGPLLGQWDFGCLPRPRYANEAREANRLRGIGLAYAREHAERLPVVLAVRLGRTFELYRPWRQAADASFYEGRNLWFARASVPAFFLLAGFAVAGALSLRRSGDPWWVLLVPFVVVAGIALISYGFSRFRAGAEPALVVLAAVGLAAAGDRLQGRRA